MIERITAIHQKEYNLPPTIIASAPGCLHLLGEQIEYAKSHVLSLALQYRAWVSLSPRSDTTLRVMAANYNERKRVSISNLKFKKEDRFANLIKGVAANLANLGCKIRGLDIAIYTDIPEHKGLGCSSAIAVATAIVMATHFRFRLSNAQLVYLAYSADTIFQEREGSLAACFIAYFAHAGTLLALDLHNGEHRNLRLSQGEYGFYLIDSLVPTPGARKELHNRHQQFELAMSQLKKNGVGKALVDYDQNEAKDYVNDLPETLRRVCLFVVEEHHRLQLAEDAIEASNLPPIGKILTKSHQDLGDLMELSCPELDWLVRHSQSVAGVLGGRLTGRGLGACAVLLIKGPLGNNAQNFLAEYEQTFGFKASLVRAVPSHKAQIHEPIKPS